MLDSITEHFAAILRKGGVSGEPCDEWELQDVEQSLGVDLPAAYRAFLNLAGERFYPFEGSHYAVSHNLSELQREGERIVQKTQIELPAEAFVFFTHQGFVIRFFLLNSGDDPAVYEFVERGTEFTQLSAHLSEFLIRETQKLQRQV
jgi:hypothetical protein